jgi:hypothetical protein
VIALDLGTITMIQGVGFLDLGTRFISSTMYSSLHGPRYDTFSTTPFTGSRLVLHASLLKGPRSHTSSNTPFTSFRLVLRVVCSMGLAPILSVLLRLLVHDLYYVQVY